MANTFCTGVYPTDYSTRGTHAENTDGISWATPYTDNDEYDFWCTHAGTKDVWSPYECTEIRCPIWRDLNTLDVTNDLSFADIKAGTSDTMDILAGRAMLYINEATTNYGTPAKGPLENLSIGVWNDAAPLLATALFAKAMFSMIF